MARRTAAASGAGPRTAASAAEPKYRRVVQTLKQEIVSGVHPVDSQLPTESELTQRFGVSRPAPAVLAASAAVRSCAAHASRGTTSSNSAAALAASPS